MLPNVWIGVSVEDRRYGLTRIPFLRRVTSWIRFLSVEPLLEDLGQIPLDGIDWVIVGGESGRGARPMKPEWALSVRDQCRAAGVPFFFKQWGGVWKKRAGRLLEGQTWNQMPIAGRGILMPLHKGA
jgi:protein gp37